MQNARLRPIFIPLAILFAAFLWAGSGLAGGQPPVKLTIMHVNDTHGHIVPYVEKGINGDVPVSGAAYLAKMVERGRAANPDGALLLSAGDMFQGTPISNLFRGRSVIDVMNYLRFDAMTLGNHEFDWGREVLRGIISSAAFPVLSANIFEQGGRPFDGARPYVIVGRKNVSVAVIGLTTPETALTSRPGNLAGLDVAPPAEVLPGVIEEVRARGAVLVIVLSHLGLDADIELAREVRGIDVIVGGHSHTAVTDPVNVSGTVIVQAGSYGVYLGVLDILFDPAEKKILEYTAKNELELVSAGPDAPFDAQAAAIVEKYESQVKSEFSKTIGSASRDLTRRPDAESNLGDLITDAMRASSGAQIAFYNGGGLRADILKGPVTLEMVYTVLPFDNTLVSMDLTGEQIAQVLEHSGRSEKIMQVSGLRVVYDRSKPAGSQVVSVEAAGKPLASEESYRIVCNDFLAAGGDGYTAFTQGRNVAFGPLVRDVAAEYISRHSPADASVEGRIRFRNK